MLHSPLLLSTIFLRLQCHSVLLSPNAGRVLIFLADTPRLSLAAGLNLDMEDIKEGDDVYFECGIKANPPVFKVQWFHNVSSPLIVVHPFSSVTCCRFWYFDLYLSTLICPTLLFLLLRLSPPEQHNGVYTRLFRLHTVRSSSRRHNELFARQRRRGRRTPCCGRFPRDKFIFHHFSAALYCISFLAHSVISFTAPFIPSHLPFSPDHI